MAGIDSENIAVSNKGLNPLVNFNFMLRVELAFDLPCKSVHAFTRELEYDYIQEGGLNDYVHMKRKPISRPFTLEVERYVGVDYFDPLRLGTEMILPLILLVAREPEGWKRDRVSRAYVFNGCCVMKKVFGELVSESSGLLTEITTIGYRSVHVIDLPHTGASGAIEKALSGNAPYTAESVREPTLEEIKKKSAKDKKLAKAAKTKAEDTFDEEECKTLIEELNEIAEKIEKLTGKDGKLLTNLENAKKALDPSPEAKNSLPNKLKQAIADLDLAETALKQAKAPLDQERARRDKIQNLWSKKLGEEQKIRDIIQKMTALDQERGKIQAELENMGDPNNDQATADKALETARVNHPNYVKALQTAQGTLDTDEAELRRQRELLGKVKEAERADAAADKAMEDADNAFNALDTELKELNDAADVKGSIAEAQAAADKLLTDLEPYNDDEKLNGLRADNMDLHQNYEDYQRKFEVNRAAQDQLKDYTDSKSEYDTLTTDLDPDQSKKFTTGEKNEYDTSKYDTPLNSFYEKYKADAETDLDQLSQVFRTEHDITKLQARKAALASEYAQLSADIGKKQEEIDAFPTDADTTAEETALNGAKETLQTAEKNKLAYDKADSKAAAAKAAKEAAEATKQKVDEDLNKWDTDHNEATLEGLETTKNTDLAALSKYSAALQADGNDKKVQEILKDPQTFVEAAKRKQSRVKELGAQLEDAKAKKTELSGEDGQGGKLAELDGQIGPETKEGTAEYKIKKAQEALDNSQASPENRKKAQDNRQKLENEVKRAGDELERVQKAKEGVELEKGKAEEAVPAAETEKTTAESEKTAALLQPQKDKDDADAEVTRVEGEVADAEAALADAKKAEEKPSEKVAAAEAKVKAAKAEQEKAETDADKAEKGQAVTAAEEELKQAEGELKSLQEDVKNAETALKNKKGELDNAKKTAAEKDAALKKVDKEATDKVNQATQKLESAKDRVTKLEAKIGELDVALTNANTEKANADAALEADQDKVDLKSLEATYDAEQKALKDAQDECEKLKAQKASAEAENTSLGTKITAMETELKGICGEAEDPEQFCTDMVADGEKALKSQKAYEERKAEVETGTRKTLELRQTELAAEIEAKGEEQSAAEAERDKLTNVSEETMAGHRKAVEDAQEALDKKKSAQADKKRAEGEKTALEKKRTGVENEQGAVDTQLISANKSLDQYDPDKKFRTPKDTEAGAEQSDAAGTEKELSAEEAKAAADAAKTAVSTSESALNTKLADIEKAGDDRAARKKILADRDAAKSAAEARHRELESKLAKLSGGVEPPQVKATADEAAAALGVVIAAAAKLLDKSEKDLSDPEVAKPAYEEKLKTGDDTLKKVEDNRKKWDNANAKVTALENRKKYIEDNELGTEDNPGPARLRKTKAAEDKNGKDGKGGTAGAFAKAEKDAAGIDEAGIKKLEETINNDRAAIEDCRKNTYLLNEAEKNAILAADKVKKYDMLNRQLDDKAAVWKTHNNEIWLIGANLDVDVYSELEKEKKDPAKDDKIDPKRIDIQKELDAAKAEAKGTAAGTAADPNRDKLDLPELNTQEYDTAKSDYDTAVSTMEKARKAKAAGDEALGKALNDYREADSHLRRVRNSSSQLENYIPMVAEAKTNAGTHFTACEGKDTKVQAYTLDTDIPQARADYEEVHTFMKLTVYEERRVEQAQARYELGKKQVSEGNAFVTAVNAETAAKENTENTEENTVNPVDKTQARKDAHDSAKNSADSYAAASGYGDKPDSGEPDGDKPNGDGTSGDKPEGGNTESKDEGKQSGEGGSTESKDEGKQSGEGGSTESKDEGKQSGEGGSTESKDEGKQSGEDDSTESKDEDKKSDAEDDSTDSESKDKQSDAEGGTDSENKDEQSDTEDDSTDSESKDKQSDAEGGTDSENKDEQSDAEGGTDSENKDEQSDAEDDSTESENKDEQSDAEDGSTDSESKDAESDTESGTESKDEDKESDADDDTDSEDKNEEPDTESSAESKNEDEESGDNGDKA